MTNKDAAHLKTARLYTRAFEAADLDRLAELFRNPGFLRFSGATEYDREKTAALLTKLLGRNKAGLPSQFALVTRQTMF